MYEVAPLDTWGIFVQKREELLAIKMIQQFEDKLKDIEGNDKRVENPPKIFSVNHAESFNEWREVLYEKIVMAAKF